MYTMDQMLQQLQNRKLQKLLLYGIPGSNFFHIDKTSAEKWINAQDESSEICKNINHKITAKFLLDTLKYIPHSELISKFRKIISAFFQQLKSKHYIIISENSKKSGYFFTMIFLLIVNNSNNEYYLPINIITRKKKAKDTAQDLEEELNKHSTEIGILDINDADYSGTQTISGTPSIVKKLNADCTNWFLYLLRAFSNDKAVSLIKETLSDITGKSKYIYGAKVPLILDQLAAYPISEDEKRKLQKCMIEDPTVNIYFDHKVASNFSTMAHYILDNQKLHTWDLTKTLTNIPLIKRCDADPSKTLEDYDPQEEKNEKYRCPAAWYKYLDYDTGIVDFSKIPRVKSQLSRSSRRDMRTRTKRLTRSKTKSRKLHSMTLRRRTHSRSSTRRNSL